MTVYINLPLEASGGGGVTSVNGDTGPVVVLTTADVADSLNKRYVTDADLTAIASIVPVYKTTVTVDFGAVGCYATATVAAAWVAANTVLSLAILPHPSDHDTEDALIEGLSVTFSNLVVGVSVDIEVHAPEETWGRYIINIIGV